MTSIDCIEQHGPLGRSHKSGWAACRPCGTDGATAPVSTVQTL